jgi:hypothetical protein
MGLAVVAFLAVLTVPAAAETQAAAPPVPPMDVHTLQNFLPIGPDAKFEQTTDPHIHTWPSTTGFLRYQWSCSVRDNYENYEKIGRPGNPGDTTFK